MHLVYLVLAALALIAIGSIAFGGAVTIVAVLILLAAAAAAFGWRVAGRMLQKRTAASESGPRDVPSSQEASYDPRRVSTRAEELVDARRQSQ